MNVNRRTRLEAHRPGIAQDIVGGNGELGYAAYVGGTEVADPNAGDGFFMGGGGMLQLDVSTRLALTARTGASWLPNPSGEDAKLLVPELNGWVGSQRGVGYT